MFIWHSLEVSLQNLPTTLHILNLLKEDRQTIHCASFGYYRGSFLKMLIYLDYVIIHMYAHLLNVWLFVECLIIWEKFVWLKFGKLCLFIKNFVKEIKILFFVFFTLLFKIVHIFSNDRKCNKCQPIGTWLSLHFLS